ncbi:MAG: hypothetical protein EHM54_03050, partial [Nitrospiraceae bacterium]
MLNPRNILFLCVLYIPLTMLSCATPERESVSSGHELSVREQSERAIEALQEISRLVECCDRKTIRPQIEAAYVDIIKKYPGSLLVHECYKKLMLIYLTEYEPPALEKAELLHDEFVRKYPESSERNLLDDTLGEVYYRNAAWKKLMDLYAPAIRRFIAKRELKSPMDMLMYAEAKFHLGDMDEARKGYNIVIFYFPASIESSLATRRLDEIVAAPRAIQKKDERMSPPDRVDTMEVPPTTVPQKTEDESTGFPESGGTLKAPAVETPVSPEAAALEEPPAPAKNKNGIYSVQVGGFENEKNAISFSEELKKKGYDAFVFKQIREDKKIFFKVMIGRFHDKTEAVEYAGSVRQKEGFKSIGVGMLEAPPPGNPVPQKASVPKEQQEAPKAPPVPAKNENGIYSVQVGFFRNEKNAISLSDKLKKKGYDAFVLRHMSEGNKIFFRILIGRFHQESEAVKQARIILRKEGM